MGNIEKISSIDRSKLDEEFYFQSLLEEAYSCKMLLDTDIEKIQFECIELLAYKTERYNSGDSSSIPIEIAESIMKSNLYTIGICLKSFDCADDALKTLKDTKILDLYNKGRKCIDSKLKTANHIFTMVMQNKLDTYNHTYNDTIIGGIKGFFKIYNPDYEAQEIHITADYPLCNPIENLVGIEFIQRYLEAIYYENMFCSYFSSEDIHHLLSGYDEGYRSLIINIFEQILTNGIGCKLAGIAAKGLNISEAEIECLNRILSEKSKADLAKMILDANKDLQDEFSIKDISLEHYMEKSLPKIISNVYHGVKEDMLDKVFIALKYPELNPKINFSFGKKMDDEQYRNIIEEIRQCRFTSDKIAIIKDKIHSLADLEDLLIDAELTSREVTSIMNELEIVEIAALAKRHPFKPDIEAVDLSESEQEFRLCLHNYILGQSLEWQNWVLKSTSLMDDDD